MEYTTELEEQIRTWVKSVMKPKRFKHVRGVVNTSARLATRYAPEEVMRCRIAAWLHDAAKHWEDSQLLTYAEEHGLEISSEERDTPMLLHGIVGYMVGAEKFGLDDEIIRSACALHTTGGANMSACAKIVYLADLIEPSRVFPAVKTLRLAARRDLNRAVLLAADHTLQHLINNSKLIHPGALALRNDLIKAGVRYR